MSNQLPSIYNIEDREASSRNSNTEIGQAIKKLPEAKKTDLKNAIKRTTSKEKKFKHNIDNYENQKDHIILHPRAKQLIVSIENAKNGKGSYNTKNHIIDNSDFDVILDKKVTNIADIIKMARIDNNPKNKGGLLIGFEKISHGSDVLKLIQVFLLTQNESILDGNNKTLMESIDGYFSDNSLTALAAYQNRLRTKESNRNDRIKGVVGDVESTIKNTGKENPDLQEKRDAHVNVLGNTVYFKSYGKESQFILSNGSVMVYVNNTPQMFPFAFKLDKSSQTDSYLENDTNKNNMKKVFSFMNVINRARYLGGQISDKAADHYRPFHIDAGPTGRKVIQVQDGIKDPQLIKESNLEQYLKPFKGAKIDDFINYLNDIHEEEYRKPIINKVKHASGGNIY